MSEYADLDDSGVITIPEVTVEGSAEAGRAYHEGYALGATGQGEYNPLHYGAEHYDDYNAGIRDGAADATAGSYGGPSAGPLSADDFERDQKSLADDEERQSEMRRFLHLAPDPDEPGPHIEPPEPPEITSGD